MNLLKKLWEKATEPLWIVRTVTAATISMSILTLFESEPSTFMAWLIGLLNGALITLLLPASDNE